MVSTGLGALRGSSKVVPVMRSNRPILRWLLRLSKNSFCSPRFQSASFLHFCWFGLKLRPQRGPSTRGSTRILAAGILKRLPQLGNWLIELSVHFLVHLTVMLVFGTGQSISERKKPSKLYRHVLELFKSFITKLCQ